MLLPKLSRNFVVGSIAKNRKLFLLALLLIILTKSAGVGLAVVLGEVLDSANQLPDSQGDVLRWIGLFTALWLTAALFSPLSTYLLSRFVQTSVLEASSRWLGKLLKKEFDFFKAASVGRVVNATDRGIAAHEKLMVHLCESMIPMSLELLISFSVMAIMGGPLIAFGVLLLALIQWGLTRRLITIRRRYVERVNEAEDDSAGTLTEVLENGLAIKIEKATLWATERMRRPLANYAEAAIKLSVSGSILSTVPVSFANLATVLIFLYGIYALNEGLFTLGLLVSLVTVSARVSQSVGEAMNSLRFFDQFKSDIAEFLEILSKEEFERDGKKPNSIRELQLDPLEYLENEHKRLELTYSLEFKEGEKVAIIGPTGGGKSTLLDILSGLNSQFRSRVLVDGIPLDQVASESHLSLIRYCPQKSHILAGTKSDGVFFGGESLIVGEVLEKLAIKERIRQSRFKVEERAVNLSGGEARRLAMSRLLLRPGNVHLFDEPTTGLNEAVSARVWEQIFENPKNALVICSTHDYQNLNRFDRVLIVDTGQIVYDGPASQVYHNASFKALGGNLPITDEKNS